MSYDIYIGQATVADNGEGEYMATVAERHEQKAPRFDNDEMTGNGNSRHPGYSQWSGWCDVSGLTALFFDEETGIMRRHPGTFSLNHEHLMTVSAALRKWKEQSPAAVAGFAHGQDPVLARLVWLDWWIRWALQNCDAPAIHNR